MIARIMRVDRTVASLDRTEAFYRDALGFIPLDRQPLDAGWTALLGGPATLLTMAWGGQVVGFTQFDQPGAPYPPDSHAWDGWFQHIAIGVADVDAAYDRLVPFGATAISQGGPQKLPASSGGVTAYKFRDPDGHPLELIRFPDGRPPGIDHSAISVADPARSIAFYGSAIGFRRQSAGLNQGEAQARLDGAPDPIVEVVALGAGGGGPHLELLGYRQPRGRPAPQAARPCDGWSTRLLIEVDVAPTGGQPARLRTDPDGHTMMLVA